MNKPALIKALVDKTKAPKDIATEFVDAIFETITTELAKGNKVSLGNFGTVYLVRHKERITTHPSTGESVTLPSLTVAKFRPSAKLKATVNRRGQ